MTRACKRNETKHTYKSVHKRVKGALAAALKPRRHSESNPRHTAPEVTTPPMLPRLAPRQATTPHTPRRSAFVAALPRTATRVGSDAVQTESDVSSVKSGSTRY